MSMSESKKKPKSPAQKLFRDLEKLGVYYMNRNIDEKIVKVDELTNATNDGGYDGKITVYLFDDKSLQHKIFLESKMRDPKYKVSLDDCSKALIIAFNNAANALYIFSNVEFAPQVIENLSIFQNKTNTVVKMIDGHSVKDFVSKNQEELKQTDVSSDFVNYILDTSFIPNDIENVIVKEKTSSKRFQKKWTVDTIIGSHRIEIHNNMLMSIKNGTNMLTVLGESGAGKTTIIKSLFDSLESEKFFCYELDLQSVSTSRVLFIKILESIWGIDLSNLTVMNKFRTQLDSLFWLPSSEPINQNMKNAVLDILYQDIKTYEGYIDEYNFLLVKYVDLILKEHNCDLRIAMSFSNLNKTRTDVIDFLLLLAKCMSDNGIRVIFEIPTPFVKYDESSPILDKAYLKKLLTVQNTQQNNRVDIFTDADAHELLDGSKLHLSDIQKKELIQRVGLLPLTLSNSIKVLTNILEASGNKRLTSKEFSDFIKSPYINNTLGNLSVLLRQLRQEQSVSEFLDILGLLRGSISYNLLDVIEASKNYDHEIAFLCDQGIIQETRDRIEVKHLYYLEAIYDTQSNRRRMRIAKELLESLKKISVYDLEIQLIELDLMLVFDDMKHILPYTVNLVSKLIESKEFNVAIDYLDKTLRLENDVNAPADCWHDLQLLLFSRFECAILTHDFTYGDFQVQLDKLKLLIRFNANKNQKTDLLKIEYIKWYKEFTAGNNPKAKELAESMVQKLEIVECDEELSGKIYKSLGLVEKEISGNLQAMQVFEDALSKHPNSNFLKAEYASHKANMLINENATAAIGEYELFIKYASAASFTDSDVLHGRVDIAMCEFVNSNVDTCIHLLNHAYEIAISIGATLQEGRSLNLLGCCHYVNGNLECAKKALEDSVYLLESCNATIYAWRAKATLASVYQDLNDNESAIRHYSDTLDILITKYKTRTLSEKKSAHFSTALAILITMKSMPISSKQLNAFTKKYSNTPLVTQLSNFSSLSDLDEFVSGKVRVVNKGITVIG